MSLNTNEGGWIDNFFGISRDKNKKAIRNTQDDLFNKNSDITKGLGNFYQSFNKDREKATIDMMGEEYSTTLQNTSDEITQANNRSIANI